MGAEALELGEAERAPALLWLCVRDLVPLLSSISYKPLLNPVPRDAIAWQKTFLALASAIEPVAILLAVSEKSFKGEFQSLLKVLCASVFPRQSSPLLPISYHYV